MSDQGHVPQERQQSINILRELIKDIHIAMLTTRSADGDLRSRPMITARHEFDGDLWFFTLDNDPKVSEIQIQPAVNITYADAAADRYVSVSGRAEVVHDPKKAELLWTEELREWFPVGPTDPDLALIRVDAIEAEYWDSTVNRLTSVVKGLFFRPNKKRKHDTIDWPEPVQQSS